MMAGAAKPVRALPAPALSRRARDKATPRGNGRPDRHAMCAERLPCAEAPVAAGVRARAKAAVAALAVRSSAPWVPSSGIQICKDHP